MTHNSKRAWSTLKKINTERNRQTRVAAVTPNQVANQLLRNGKPLHKERGRLKAMKRETAQIIQDSNTQFDPFSQEDLHEAISTLKPGKAAGLDNISTEMIQHFGPKALEWVLNLTNSCATSYTIPKIWRRAKVVALLKPGKEPEQPKSFRSISLFCILYKLYERMVLARISQAVEDQLRRPG